MAVTADGVWAEITDLGRSDAAFRLEIGVLPVAAVRGSRTRPAISRLLVVLC